jgi:hypothetical protein
MMDKNYCEAVVIAFKANYTRLFMNVLEKINEHLDAEQSLEENGEGKLVVKMGEDRKRISQEEMSGMVQKLKDIDLGRLMVNLQTMVSTVRLYKIANTILLTILKSTTLA